MAGHIRELTAADAPAVSAVINEAAEAYAGVIPAESDTDPYMPLEDLEEEIGGMRFYGLDHERLVGVIGVQERSDVTLIRHLYVRPAVQGEGIGTRLLEWGLDRAGSATVLVGTWKAATWAIGFYEAFGFKNLGSDQELLAEYWDVPDHQMAASVVLRFDRR